MSARLTTAQQVVVLDQGEAESRAEFMLYMRLYQGMAVKHGDFQAVANLATWLAQTVSLPVLAMVLAHAARGAVLASGNDWPPQEGNTT